MPMRRRRMWPDAGDGDDNESKAARASDHVSLAQPTAVMQCSAHVRFKADVVRRQRHNNRCAEMLATVRRGAFAKPTDLEQIEYL